MDYLWIIFDKVIFEAKTEVTTFAGDNFKFVEDKVEVKRIIIYGLFMDNFLIIF